MIAAPLAILRAGGVVGIPTETVYGLAADARRDDAVARVFSLKGRPSTNPLIVHVASVEIAERYAVVDDRARQLFAAFSPGALTVVLACKGEIIRDAGASEGRGEDTPAHTGEQISRLVTAGLNTVGIRIPDHPLALELLRAFDGPLAAPSANKSNHISPTTAEHLRAEFGDAVPILDGGPCRVGIESTVISLTNSRPTILRPGSVSRKAIEAVIGSVEAFTGYVEVSNAAVSPGQQRVHYAPRAQAFRFTAEEFHSLFSVVDQGAAAFILLTFNTNPGFAKTADRLIVAIGPDAEHATRQFYAALREADERGPNAIYIEMPPDEPQWAPLRDRITRATGPWRGRG